MMKWGIVVLVIGLGMGIWIALADEPPVEVVGNARKVLSEAEQLNAEMYCHRLYREARTKFDTAMVLWRRENERFIVLRSFDSVRVLAQQALEGAEQAVKKAGEMRHNTRKEAQEEIAALRREMMAFEKLFVSLPLEKRIIRQHSHGKLLLNEVEIAFEKGDCRAEKIREAARLIRGSYKSGQRLLEEYFLKLPLWQKQLNEMIAWSEANKEYVVVVQKIPALCMLYYNGKKKYSFPVEFGRNWLGDKLYEGDMATPEGVYHVVKRLQEPMTRYHKALLLDYPNADDRKRLEQLKKKGRIPRNARPGGLIEVHGNGGRGANWTNGCVALADEDMDIVFWSVGKGTPVLIIGAEKELLTDEDGKK